MSFSRNAIATVAQPDFSHTRRAELLADLIAIVLEIELDLVELGDVHTQLELGRTVGDVARDAHGRFARAAVALDPERSSSPISNKNGERAAMIGSPISTTSKTSTSVCAIDEHEHAQVSARRWRARYHDRRRITRSACASSSSTFGNLGLPSDSRMLKPVEKQRVAEEIAEQLRSLILNGQYPPGSKLPPERELSKRLRVNRASLREALKKLEHLGLVRIRQGDGTRVQNFMETGGIELVQHLLPLAGGKPELIRDLLEFRRIMGREIARLAAARGAKDGTVASPRARR